MTTLPKGRDRGVWEEWEERCKTLQYEEGEGPGRSSGLHSGLILETEQRASSLLCSAVSSKCGRSDTHTHPVAFPRPPWLAVAGLCLPLQPEVQGLPALKDARAH